MKIIELIRKKENLPEGVPQKFTLNEPAIPPNGHMVSEILYCRDGYSGGGKGRYACYAIKFSTSEEIRLIPESEVLEVCLDGKIKAKDENPEASVELPPSPNAENE